MECGNGSLQGLCAGHGGQGQEAQEAGLLAEPTQSNGTIEKLLFGGKKKNDQLVLVSQRGKTEGEKKNWTKQHKQGSNEPHFSGSCVPFVPAVP